MERTMLVSVCCPLFPRTLGLSPVFDRIFLLGLPLLGPGHQVREARLAFLTVGSAEGCLGTSSVLLRLRPVPHGGYEFLALIPVAGR